MSGEGQAGLGKTQRGLGGVAVELEEGTWSGTLTAVSRMVGLGEASVGQWFLAQYALEGGVETSQVMARDTGQKPGMPLKPMAGAGPREVLAEEVEARRATVVGMLAARREGAVVLGPMALVCTAAVRSQATGRCEVWLLS